MEENKVHFRYLMLFFYRKDKNATQAANKIYAVYGEGYCSWKNCAEVVCYV